MAIRTDVRIGELGSLQRLIDDPRTPEIHRKDAQRQLERLIKKPAKDSARRARLHRALDAVLGRDAIDVPLHSKMIHAMMHSKMVHALTDYDRRQSTKPGFNRYALSLYFGALDDVEALVAKGKTWDQAIDQCFNGRVAQLLKRVIGA